MRRFTISFLATCLLLLVLEGPASASEPRLVLRAPVDAPVKDPFRSPRGFYGAGNRGIEYLTAPGQPVVAAAAGRIQFSGSVGGAKVITVRHAGGYQTTYTGLLGISVDSGDMVRAGGSLGRASRSLHFGFKLRGQYLDPALAFGSSRTRAWLIPANLAISDSSITSRIAGGIGGVISVVGHTIIDGRGIAVGVFVETANGVGWIVNKSGEIIGAGYQVGLEVLQIPLAILADAQQLALLLPDGPLEQLRDLWNIYSGYRRSQDECTAKGTAPSFSSSRRIAVFVPGLGSSSSDPEEFAGSPLGYEDGDVVHFSYAGGAIPGTGINLGVGTSSYEAEMSGQDIRLSAQYLVELLESVQLENPGVPIDIIAHSQGGLVARHAIQNSVGGASTVENLVTLGTPHQGSPHAKTAIIANSDPQQNFFVEQASIFPVDLDSPSLRQLVPGSAFLENLAKGEMPPNITLRSVGSRSDVIVPANMVGVGAHGEFSIISGVSHGELPTSTLAMREVGLAVAGMAPTCRGVFDFFLDQVSGETIEFASAGLNLIQLEVAGS